MNIYNIYCDETCHLPNDHQGAMALGGIWCNQGVVTELHQAIAELKAKHKLSRFYEAKWTKVSGTKVDFYLDLVDFFFAHDDLHFRAWIIPDKSILRHDDFDQTHDDWYYKMYYYLLQGIITEDAGYHVYLDIKDTRSRNKLRKLWDVICSANHDHSQDIIQRIQHVHSHEIGLLQLADVLIGAVGYVNRGLPQSPGKKQIVDLIQEKSRLSLKVKTGREARKVNLFFWNPSSTNGGQNA